MRLVLDSLAPMSSLSATTPHLRVLSEVSAHTCELMERHDATTLIAPANPHTVRMETSIGKTLVGRAELVAISPSELHMLSLDGPRGLYPSAHPMLGIK